MIVSSHRYFKFKEVQNMFLSESQKHPQDRIRLVNALMLEINYHQMILYRAAEENQMTKKVNKKKFEWKGYVNIGIPANHSERIQNYIKDGDKVFLDMNRCIIEAYTVKVFFDEDEEHFRASLTCYDSDSDNYGHMVGAFADDWFTALAVVLYKHLYVANSKWNMYSTSSQQSFG